MDKASFVEDMMQQVSGALCFGDADPFGMRDLLLVASEEIHERFVVHLEQRQAEKRAIKKTSQMVELDRQHVSLTFELDRPLKRMP